MGARPCQRGLHRSRWRHRRRGQPHSSLRLNPRRPAVPDLRGDAVLGPSAHPRALLHCRLDRQLPLRRRPLRRRRLRRCLRRQRPDPDEAGFRTHPGLNAPELSVRMNSLRRGVPRPRTPNPAPADRAESRRSSGAVLSAVDAPAGYRPVSWTRARPCPRPCPRSYGGRWARKHGVPPRRRRFRSPQTGGPGACPQVHARPARGGR
jgi:hypothetical protein